MNKTQQLIFSNKNNNINMHKSITINNTILQKVENNKSLGVIYISSIKKKVSRGIPILCKAGRLLKA